MSMKKSLLNKSMMINDIKRYWWASAAYASIIIFLVILPLMELPIVGYMHNEYQTDRLAGIAMMLVVAGGIGFSVLFFSYMNKKGSSEFTYSLPFTKNEIFFTKFFTGAIALSVILTVAFLICQSILISKTNAGALDALVGVKLYCMIILFALLAYSVGSCTAMFTSSSISSGILAVVYILFPSGFTSIISKTMERFVFGYTGIVRVEYTTGFSITRIMNPLSDSEIYSSFNNIANFGGVRLVNVFICIIIYMLISNFLHKKRKVEETGNLIVYKWFKPVLKFGFVFCTTLLIPLFFGRGYVGSGIWMALFQYSFAMVISYCAIVSFIEKSPKAVIKKKTVKEIGIVLILMNIIILGTWGDVFKFGEFQVALKSNQVLEFRFDGNGISKDIEITTSDDEIVGEINRLCNEIYLRRNNRKGYYSDVTYVSVRLRDDKSDYMKIKHYRIDTNLFADYDLSKLYGTKENRQKKIKNIKSADDIMNFELEKGVLRFNNSTVSRTVFDRVEIEKIYEAIRKDFEEMTIEELIDNETLGVINIVYGIQNKKYTPSTTINVTKGYHNTLKVIEELGLSNTLFTAIDEIESVQIYEIGSGNRYFSKKEIISELLKCVAREETDPSYARGDVHVQFKFKNNFYSDSVNLSYFRLSKEIIELLGYKK